MEMPRVGIGVIVLKGGKVLCMKRKGSHGGGTWCFPGGHLEPNESFEGCARREVREEAGIEIQNTRFAAVTNDLFRKEGKHYITIFLLADWASGEARIQEPEKATGMGWFSWDALPEPRFIPQQNLLAQGYNPFT